MHKCKNCSRKFETMRGKHIHETRSGHWQDPVPPPKPQTEHTPFATLVANTNWGQQMTAAERNNPSDRVLAFGYQARTVQLLEAIYDELKRERTIK